MYVLRNINHNVWRLCSRNLQQAWFLCTTTDHEYMHVYTPYFHLFNIILKCPLYSVFAWIIIIFLPNIYREGQLTLSSGSRIPLAWGRHHHHLHYAVLQRAIALASSDLNLLEWILTIRCSKVLDNCTGCILHIEIIILWLQWPWIRMSTIHYHVRSSHLENTTPSRLLLVDAPPEWHSYTHNSWLKSQHQVV